MRFCNKIGIRHSEFLSWEDEDRAKALAYEFYDAKICGMCGTAPWEWDEKQGGSRFAYEPKEEICPGCERKDWVKDTSANKPGRYVTLVRPEGNEGG